MEARRPDVAVAKKRPPSKELRDLRRRLQKELTITADARPKLDRHGLGYQPVRRKKTPKPPTNNSLWVAGGTLLEEKRRLSGEVEQDGAKEASRGEEGPAQTKGRATVEIGSMVDPGVMYASINNTYLRRRIEEPRNLSVALTYVARHHARGRNICWPYPEAESRLRLRVEGLPSKVEELTDLLQETFHAREEALDINEVVDDYARVYGRVQYDWTKPYDQASRVVRH